MAEELGFRTSIVLFGLNEPLAGELKCALGHQSRLLISEPLASVSECRRVIDGLGADLVFCPAEGKNYRILLEAARGSERELPVVVVSRHAQVTEWLDALEDGAADYCAAPLEAVQMHWILDCCLQSRQRALRGR